MQKSIIAALNHVNYCFHPSSGDVSWTRKAVVKLNLHELIRWLGLFHILAMPSTDQLQPSSHHYRHR